MQSYRRHRRKHRMSDMNVVPYIDIMLVLLIIFMVATPLLTQQITVQLPKANVSKTVSAEGTAILVTVRKDGTFYLQDQEIPISQEELINTVKQEVSNNKNYQVFVKGETGTVYDDIIKVVALLQEEVGIEGINLLVNQ